MRATFPVVNNTFLIKSGLDGVRSGDIISIKITENNKGLIKAVVKGHILNLKGSAYLKAGQSIKVRAEWNGKTLFLNRIDVKGGFKQIFDESGIRTSVSLHILDAVKRAGLHLKDENIRLLKRLLRNKKELSREEARTAAEAIKKGLSADEMITIFGGAGGDQKREHRKTLLFNHFISGDEHWFIIPYNFSSDSRSMKGSIRIKKNIRNHQIISVVLEAGVENGRLFFILDDYNAEKSKIRVFSEGKISAKTKKLIKKGLPEILGNLPLKFDDNIIEQCVVESGKDAGFDGYSAADAELSGVEEVV